MLVNFLKKASHAIFSSTVFDDNSTALFKFDDSIDFSFVIHLWLFVDFRGGGGGRRCPFKAK